MNCLLVAGISGYVGNAFVQRFNSQLPIIGISRPPQARADVLHSFIPLSALEHWALSPERRAPSAMLHLIGSGRETTGTALYDANVRSTQRIINFCRRLSIPRIVYLSGYGVSLKTTSGYYCTKALGEALIRRSGIHYIIIRSSYIVGRGDELTPWIFRAAKSGIVPIPGDGTYRIQPVYIDDLLDVLFAACHCAQPSRRTLNVLGQPVTFRQFVRDVGRIVSHRCRLMPINPSHYMREAVSSDAPLFSLSELAILFADIVGAATRSALGVPVRQYNATISTIRNQYHSPEC